LRLCSSGLFRLFLFQTVQHATSRALKNGKRNDQLERFCTAAICIFVLHIKIVN
jgi:hypothetical protein